MRPSTNRNAGFTLVELLVTLAIVAMMATMLLGGLQTVARFGQRAADRTATDDGIAAAQRILRNRLETLRPVPELNSPTVDANGDETSFTFVGPPLARAEPDSLWRYRIMVTATGDLLLMHANSLDDRYSFASRATTGWQPVTLLRNVQSVRINYFGERLVGPGRGWQVGWLRRPQPPALVRIRVTFRPGDARVWPDLIVRPRASVNTACRIDILSGRCGAPA
jgi:general secretion pathway protein J